MGWELWRQDDNGNRFLVGCFSSHAAARSRLDELGRTPHKQISWITAESTAKGILPDQESDQES
jgi:hypothetical protein